MNFKEYTNLPAGSYTFRVKYIIKGTSGGETPLVSVEDFATMVFFKACYYYLCNSFCSDNLGHI